MVNSPSSFCTQFFHIPIAEAVAAIPPHTPEDNRGQKMTPLEPARLGHVGKILQTGASYPTMNSLFATKPISPTAD